MAVYPSPSTSRSRPREQPVAITVTLNDLGDTLPHVVDPRRRRHRDRPDADQRLLYTPAGRASSVRHLHLPDLRAHRAVDLRHRPRDRDGRGQAEPAPGRRAAALQTTTGRRRQHTLTALDPDAGQSVPSTGSARHRSRQRDRRPDGTPRTSRPGLHRAATRSRSWPATTAPRGCARGHRPGDRLPAYRTGRRADRRRHPGRHPGERQRHRGRRPSHGRRRLRPQHGTADRSPGQPGVFRYTPESGFTGTDTFDYQACSPDGTACATATVTVVVAAGPRRRRRHW